MPHRDEFTDTVGYRIERGNRQALFIPDIDQWSKWSRSIREMVEDVDLAFLDGTFASPGELPGRSTSDIPHPLIPDTRGCSPDRKRLSGSSISITRIPRSVARMSSGTAWCFRSSLTMPAIRVAAAGLALSLAATAAPVRVASQTAAPSAVALLDRYERVDYDAAASLSRIEATGWVAFAGSLETGGSAWIRQAPAPALDRRRLVAISFALEAASVVLESPARLVARRILGWACTEARIAAPGDEVRAWYRASIVLLERAEDWDLLLGTGADGELKAGHLSHARAALGDDAPLRLSAAVGGEGRSWGGEPANLQGMVRRLPGASRAGDLDPIAEHFSALTSAPDVGPEAALRLAVTNLRRGQVDAAAFARVAQSSRDPFVLYVSRLVGGAILLQQRRPADAISSFRDALTQVPRAQSAGTLLVSALTSIGALDEARKEADVVIAGPPPADPWRQYRSGSGRQWPQALRDLRARVK